MRGLHIYRGTLRGGPRTLNSSVKLRRILSEVWALIKPRRAVLALGLMLIVIARVAGLVLPASTKYVIDDVLGKGKMGLLGPLVLAVLAATVVKGLISFSLTQLISKSAVRLIADLRRRIQSHVGRLPVAYFDANQTGALVSRIMSDVEGLRNLAGTGAVELVGGLITGAIAFLVLVSISPSLTVVSLLAGLGLMLILHRAFAILRPMFHDRCRINAEVTGRLTESLAGVRVIKSYRAEAREADVFWAGVQRLLNNVLRTLTGTAVVNFAATLLVGITAAAVMYMGARQVSSGVLTLGDFVKFTAFLAVMVGPMFQVTSIGTQLTEALAGLQRICEVLAEKPEDEDPNRSVAVSRIKGEVRFENVSFAYPSGNSVLEEISFEAKPGTVTALVGPSGSGKSTMIGLVAAFYVPSTGKVRVDGIDLATVNLSSYRTQLGVVFQQTFLFDGTVRENVVFARPDATEEEMLEACRIAHVDEFAESLEKKYDTAVGERGVKLSGGQCQRVSIARAILANPRILVLDEATSSLDSESEALIQEGLAHLMKGRTTFVIAHRLSTVRRADQILVMEGGRIIERGNHKSLSALRGRYFELYKKQQGVESDLFLVPSDQSQDDHAVANQEPDELADKLSLLRDLQSRVTGVATPA